MPDEAITAPSADTSFDAPAADTPITDPGNHDAGQVETQTPDDAEQGYLRHSDYTRKTQELAQSRQEFEAQQAELGELLQAAFVEQDEDAGRQLLEMAGYEFDEDEGTGSYADNPETAQLKQQLDDLTEWKSQQEADAEARQNAVHIQSELERLGVGSWDENNPQHNAIFALALNHESEDGLTNVEAGFKEFSDLRDSIINEFRQSKTAPVSDQFGSPASAATPENASLEERAALAMERNGF